MAEDSIGLHNWELLPGGRLRAEGGREPCTHDALGGAGNTGEPGPSP